MASTSTLDANPAWFGPPHDRAEPLWYAAMDDTALRQRIDELYREHRAAIARHIRALTQDSASTDDLVNETFLRAYRALRSFEDRSSISTWLHGIAVNVTRTHLDKHRRRDRLDLRLAEQQAELAVPGPERQAEARRSIERFRQLVVELPTPLREAYVMRVIEQQSWHDVSTALGVPISTLHGRVSRAEAQIKAAWEEGS
jgi:RNA polymerase sigma-70 factor (ECF subfamily)